jgi:CNT family concentrative nucleoside transporter
MTIGGLATIVPERRAEIAGLGMRSILAGTLATLSTVVVVGIVY